MCEDSTQPFRDENFTQFLIAPTYRSCRCASHTHTHARMQRARNGAKPYRLDRAGCPRAVALVTFSPRPVAVRRCATPNTYLHSHSSSFATRRRALSTYTHTHKHSRAQGTPLPGGGGDAGSVQSNGVAVGRLGCGAVDDGVGTVCVFVCVFVNQDNVCTLHCSLGHTVRALRIIYKARPPPPLLLMLMPSLLLLLLRCCGYPLGDFNKLHAPFTHIYIRIKRQHSNMYVWVYVAHVPVHQVPRAHSSSMGSCGGGGVGFECCVIAPL